MSGQWLRDPEGRFEYRWYDGQNWTDQVSHQGQVFPAPLGPPPGGGAPAPAQQAEPHAEAAQAQAQPQPQGDGFSGISVT